MSIADQFAKPAAPNGDRLDLHLVQGSLLVFEVTEALEHVQTAFTEPGKQSPAVRTDVYVLDGPHQGMAKKDVLIFPRGLQAQLRPSIGGKVLGRLTRGVPLQAGQSAPWRLDSATEADLAVAAEWLRQRDAQQFAQPTQGNQDAQAPF